MEAATRRRAKNERKRIKQSVDIAKNNINERVYYVIYNQTVGSAATHAAFSLMERTNAGSKGVTLSEAEKAFMNPKFDIPPSLSPPAHLVISDDDDDEVVEVMDPNDNDVVQADASDDQE